MHLSISPLSQTLPTDCSQLIQDTIETAAASAGFSSTRLPSGAGHDGVFVARIAPMGMIFVPCRDGRSHAPEEWAEPADCAKGARILAETLILLDRLKRPSAAEPFSLVHSRDEGTDLAKASNYGWPQPPKSASTSERDSNAPTSLLP